MGRRRVVGAMKKIMVLCGVGAVSIALHAEPIDLKTDLASCTVETDGARILSFKGPGGVEAVWNADPVQVKAEKWAHGGIPVCWPWFGVDGTGDFHGTAWRRPFAVVSKKGDGRRAELVLVRTEEKARIECIVSLGGALKVELRTTNTSGEPFSFSAAFHPYFLVGDVTKTSVGGVNVPSADGASAKPISMAKPIDDVYPVGPGPCATYRLFDPVLDRTIFVFAENSTEVNVWNPGAPKDTPGFIPGDSWRQFACVEPIAGSLEKPIVLQPGDSHSLVMGVDVRKGSKTSAQLVQGDDEQDYLRRKFREDVTDGTTGIGLDALKAEAERLVAAEKDSLPWCIVKAHLFEMICDRMSVGFSPHDFFPAFACWSRRDRVLTKVINDRMQEVDRRHCPDTAKKASRVSGSYLRHDYDHAVPDWDRILRLGFPGIKAAADASPATNDFARAMSIAADAMLRNVKRLADAARKSECASSPRVRNEIAALDALAEGPPRTAYEAMMFQLLFFVYGEHVDHLQVRSLGNWDRLMLPYYEADVAAGRTTRQEFKERLKHFWWQWGSIDNWWGQPVYIGGTRANGSTEYSEVSRIVLEVSDELALPTPKLQLKIAKNTPDDIFSRALDMARRHRSVVFCGEEPMAKAMSTLGFSAEEARTCDIWGCYEFQPRATANTTLPCIINIPRIVVDLLGEARAGRFAAATFEEFEGAFLGALRERAAISLDVAREYEAVMDDFIPALVHSLSIEGCVRDGKNAIGDGMKYNLTLVLQAGAGTAVDALAAVKEIVYERREMSLGELGGVMAANWAGHEELRLRMCASRRKWGSNDPLTNRLTHDLYHAFGATVNGKPNSRGGIFVAGGHSVDFFVIFGKRTGATPDGRKAGEEFSKNISTAPGADREGPTALIASMSAIDCADIPGDIILDMTIHPSLVRGEKGLATMKALVDRYFAAGGTAIHFNIFSAEELRDAQLHPERYENLQVRVCGWNVRWNDLSRAEQDAYIRRAENALKGY